MGRQDTLRGQARIYLSDGSEWEYALWARIEGPGATITNGVARPLSPASGRAGAEAPALLLRAPDPALLALGRALDIAGSDGIVTRLAAAGRRRTWGRRTDWGGHPAVAVEVIAPRGGPAVPPGYPRAWRLVLDPRSKLVVAASGFTGEGGGRRLVMRCEYEYNLALPAGFKEGTGLSAGPLGGLRSKPPPPDAAR